MRIEKIDHVVITVKDLNKTIDFYTNILGMKLAKFSSSLDNNQIRYAVSFGSQKINIHEENINSYIFCSQIRFSFILKRREFRYQNKWVHFKSYSWRGIN